MACHFLFSISIIKPSWRTEYSVPKLIHFHVWLATNINLVKYSAAKCCSCCWKYDGIDAIQDFWRSCERQMAFVFTLFGSKMQNFILFYFGKRSWILHSKVFVEVKLLKGFKWFWQGCKVHLLFEQYYSCSVKFSYVSFLCLSTGGIITHLSSLCFVGLK